MEIEFPSPATHEKSVRCIFMSHHHLQLVAHLSNIWGLQDIFLIGRGGYRIPLIGLFTDKIITITKVAESSALSRAV